MKRLHGLVLMRLWMLFDATFTDLGGTELIWMTVSRFLTVLWKLLGVKADLGDNFTVLSSLKRFYVMTLMRCGMLLKARSLFGRQLHVLKRFYGLVLMKILMVLKAKS